MKKISNFLLREMPSYIKKIQEDFERLNSSLDTTKSAIKEQLPSFKGNYTKIGEYYSMAQELNEIKKQIHEIQELFSIEETSSNELSTEVEHIVADDRGEYENDMLKENERINYGDYMFFASTFWRKMQNIFGECCISKLEKVARPRLAAILPAT